MFVKPCLWVTLPMDSHQQNGNIYSDFVLTEMFFISQFNYPSKNHKNHRKFIAPFCAWTAPKKGLALNNMVKNNEIWFLINKYHNDTYFSFEWWLFLLICFHLNKHNNNNNLLTFSSVQSRNLIFQLYSQKNVRPRILETFDFLMNKIISHQTNKNVTISKFTTI